MANAVKRESYITLVTRKNILHGYDIVKKHGQLGIGIDGIAYDVKDPDMFLICIV